MRRKLSRFLVSLVLIALVVIMLYPMYWTVINSLKTNSQLFNDSWSFPKVRNWRNYQMAWNYGVKNYIINSFLVTLGTLLVVISVGALGAYGFSRFEFKGKSVLFLLVLGGLMLSPEVSLIPLFGFIQNLGLYDSHLGLVIIYTAFRLPFTIFLLVSYFVSIPHDIEESAYIDGCNSFQVFLKVMLPLSRPIIAGTTIFQSLWVWNEFLFALVFLESDVLKTIPVGLMTFQNKLATNWTGLLASLVIASLPIVTIFLLMRKQFIRGITLGAVKG